METVVTQKYTAENPMPISTPSLISVMKEDSSDSNLIYSGYAVIGSSESEAVWQIKRIDTTTLVKTLFAGGNSSFNNIWDNREGLSYS